MAAVQHRATTRTSNTDNSTTKTKSKATSARKSPATKRKRVSAETARAAAALKGLAVEAPAPSIEANEPGQFGRINVMDITPAEERGIFPARVELGEPFEMTAQVFIEGRTKVGATAIVRNPRGKETMRRAMTCVNPGLDRWTVMVKCGEHSDLKPWEDGYAAVKRQLGEWTVTIEGWEDAYVSWLHDARIKVRVMDDVDNAGTMDDFKALCQRAHELGLEIALDFALQCSPDHPWVKAHPNWFRHKPDGSIAFAENPPKKYQDIYPIDFNADMPGIEKEVERIMNLWIEAGVTIFRIDNPHTKPVRFWQDVIAAVTKKHPEILFLAEAFTRPGMMRALSYVGFTQSHCYFPWRNTKDELEEYLPVTNGDDGYYQHNTFWPTTPDILTAYVRDNGVAGHCVRAVLAAMGSPSWGIYNGYELIENKQRPGFEEQIDNEKYEVKVRDWSKAKQYGVAEMLTALNKIRRAHPAALSYHNLTVLPTSDPNILAFARHTPAELTGTGQADTLIVVVNLDGHNAHQSMIHLELSELGLPTDRPLNVRDELTGREFQWGWDNYVSLAPWADVAHILSVQ